MSVFASKIGYEYKSVPGDSAAHRTNGLDKHWIEVGRDQPLQDKVIAFAHELGHALDFKNRPITEQELVDHVAGSVTAAMILREQKAWSNARKVLQKMGCYNTVKPRFLEFSKECLDSYVSAYNLKRKK